MDLATVVVAIALVVVALLVKRALRVALLVAAIGCIALRFGLIAPGAGSKVLADLLHFLPFTR